MDKFHTLSWSLGGAVQYPPLRKKDFLLSLEGKGDHPPQHYNPSLHGKFAVQMGANNYMYRLIPWRACYDSYCAGVSQFHHEMLGGPCKMFFDIDLAEKPADMNVWMREFFGMLSNAIGGDAATLQREFEMYVRPRVEGAKNFSKFSLHLIANNGVFFQSVKALGIYLKSKITDIDDWRRFGIDDKYKEGNLQPIGGVKYDEWADEWNRSLYRGRPSPIFRSLRKPGEISYAEFLRGFVNYIPHDFVPHEEGGAVDRQVEDRAVYKGSFRRLVELAVQEIKKIDGNEDAEISFFGDGDVDEKCIFFKLKDCPRCIHLIEGEPNHARPQSCVVYTAEEWAVFQCGCNPPAERQKFPLTDYGLMCREFARVTLPQIAANGHDRVDFPITSDELGRRALTFDWHLSQGYEDFAFHPPRQGTGHMFSLLIWNYISGQADFDRCARSLKLMMAYVNLFFNDISDMKMVVMRTPEGYAYYTQEQVKRTQMVKFQFPTEVEYGNPNKDGEVKTKTVIKSFYDNWVKGDNRVFTSSRLGEFWLKSDRGLRFNASPPSATNFTKCLDEWKRLRPGSFVQPLVSALWDRYLSIVTGNELQGAREECRAWLERWILTILFCHGRKNFVNVWLVSMEHGTGKSTMFEIMCKALGTSVAITSKSIIEFVKSRFNVSGNKSLVFFDDAIPVNMSVGDANAFKNLVTNQYAKSAIKQGEENKMDANIMNFGMAVNPDVHGKYIPGISTEKERRNFAQEVMNSAQQEIFLSSDDGRYECMCGGDEVCNNHSFSSMSDFWTLFREQIMGNSANEVGALFGDFIGMLFEKFLALQPSWKRSLQICLPVCQAIEKHQMVAATPVQQWFDDCMHRGYTVCPFGGGQDVFQMVKQVLWPEMQTLVADGGVQWIATVPLTTLYKAYKQEVGGAACSEKNFLAELNQISTARRSAVLQELMLPCKSYEYKLDGTAYPPAMKWVEVSGQSKKARCVVLPSMAVVPRGAFVQRQSSLAGVDLRLDLTLSRRPDEDSRSMHRSKSREFGSLSLLDDVDSDTSSGQKRQRSNLRDAVNGLRLLDGENAQEQFMAATAQISSPFLSESLSVQEEWAAREDEEDDRRRLKRRGIDDEAEEMEEIESSCSLQIY